MSNRLDSWEGCVLCLLAPVGIVHSNSMLGRFALGVELRAGPRFIISIGQLSGVINLNLTGTVTSRINFIVTTHYSRFILVTVSDN